MTDMEKYKKLEFEKNNIRDLIDGSLNRISITDDDEERYRQFYSVSRNALIYIKLSREAHELFENINRTNKIQN